MKDLQKNKKKLPEKSEENKAKKSSSLEDVRMFSF